MLVIACGGGPGEVVTFGGLVLLKDGTPLEGVEVVFSGQIHQILKATELGQSLQMKMVGTVIGIQLFGATGLLQ